MNDDEAIAAVLRGERVHGICSLHTEAKPERCAGPCRWREIFCNSDHDVVECAKCGRQKVVRCTFDDDFA